MSLRRKVGRPKGSTKESTRTKRLMIRLTEDELEEIRTDAAKRGGKVSDYVRGKLLGWRL